MTKGLNHQRWWLRKADNLLRESSLDQRSPLSLDITADQRDPSTPPIVSKEFSEACTGLSGKFHRFAESYDAREGELKRLRDSTPVSRKIMALSKRFEVSRNAFQRSAALVVFLALRDSQAGNRTSMDWLCWWAKASRRVGWSEEKVFQSLFDEAMLKFEQIVTERDGTKETPVT